MNKLKTGDKVPGFIGKDQDGNTISLSDYNGKKLILYFYPKDNTSGCTAEACSLRDAYPDFMEKGYEVLGVSPDSEKSHQNFIGKHNLPFRLLADIDHKIAELYNVWGEKKMYGRTYMGIIRTTFVIDENGNIQQIIEKVDTKNHAEQILR
ncbi:MAG: thioredoxin-dependent thiol peroxidase [Prevotellaceae bacterium]|jgi:peroxiredoxin Q/BCP|nr:thioredoxin-dependent thiol peroxidase [Prevotellaceae bacterium]